jgi:hypothetical protein
MSALPSRRYRVVVIEWLSHVAVIDSESESAAEAKARELWDAQAESECFSFEDSGIDGVMVDEMPC